MYRLNNINRLTCKPNLYEIFRFQFSTAGAKSMSITESKSIYKFIDNKGEIINSAYSRTVEENDFVIFYSIHPENITQIDFNNKGLKGSLENLNLCKNLTLFRIQTNSLTGNFPNIYNLNSLTDLRCHANSFSGHFPNISYLPNLSTFFIYQNSFSGKIPSLAGCPSLTDFRCFSNSFSGTIPNLDNNTALVTFLCYLNNLTNSIPSLTYNVNLSSLQCYSNQLTGDIPDLSTNIKLTNFECQINQLTGYINNGVSNTLGTFNARTNLLTQTAIDNILQDFVNAGRTSSSGTCVLNLGGTGNAAPSLAGYANVTILQGRGWTVTVN